MPAELDRDEIVRRNRRFFDGPFGPVYSFYMEHERVSQLIARVVWGSDVRPYYASMTAISQRADARAITLGDARADLFCSYFGLHCFPDPEAALREAARCLRPGGRLIGGTIVTGTSLRQRLLVRPGHGAFGPVGDADDLGRWLQSAGFVDAEVDDRGAFACFSATRAGRTIE